MAATLSVLKFSATDGATTGFDRPQNLQKQGQINIQDAAVARRLPTRSGQRPSSVIVGLESGHSMVRSGACSSGCLPGDGRGDEDSRGSLLARTCLPPDRRLNDGRLSPIGILGRRAAATIRPIGKDSE